MDFVNHFKGVRKMEKNMYNDFEVAWAEYEYVCTSIKTKILDLIEEDYGKLIENYGIRDELYTEIDIKDNNIIITLKPGILVSTVKKIEDFLGVDGKIMIQGSKKNARIRLSFHKNTE